MANKSKTSATKKNAAKNSIQVFPAKRFFVDSLTRDIDLADAILDLLDNCVDGARRLGLHEGEKPYEGFKADIQYSANNFSITDNCGGISLKDAINSAFRFGRPAEHVAKEDGTIGVIGIGMKRAIFKIGRKCVVHSHHKSDTFEVSIDPEWLKSENWTLYFNKVSAKLPNKGTRIFIENITETVISEFESELFKKKLWEKVSGAFALLIARGFSVSINGQPVESKIPTLLWQDQNSLETAVIQPFVFRDEVDGVDVYIVVGFREADRQSEDDDETKSYYQTAPAGWTVACNDRVILYCDKSEQTGWGTGRVPEYHTQFIRISGFAEFQSKDPTKLPFTTTKHGINQQSKVFLKVFDKMRDGLKIFTEWTNQYKDYGSQKKEIFDLAQARSLGVEDIKKLSTAQASKAKTGAGSTAFTSRPKLPRPKVDGKERTIQFRRANAEVETVSLHLFGSPDEKPARVGEQCFELILKRATK